MARLGKTVAPTATAPDPDEIVLAVKDLRIWYAGLSGPIKAVDGVSFALRRGEVLGLVGESGCGKSTLGRGLLGLRPDSAGMDGEITFRGRNLVQASAKDWPAYRGDGLGMIFQEPMTRLDPLMRISDHFREALRDRGKVSKKEADRLRPGIAAYARYPAVPVPQLPARVLRRHAAAHHDRAGAGDAAGVRRRRRADNRPGRAGGGADHPDPGADRGPPSHRPCC